MRLRFALPLLVAVSSVLGAPAAPSNENAENWPTTVEIFTENVTRTIVHEVTEPTVTNDDQIAEARKWVETAEKKLEEAEKELEKAEQYAASLGIDVNSVDPTLSNDAPTTVTEATTVAVKTTTTTSITTTTEVTTTTEEVIETKRVCACHEMDECRRESQTNVDTCMDVCGSHIESYGPEGASYYKSCFTKYDAAIIEAENCLFKDNRDFCHNGRSPRNITETDFDEFTKITYKSEADPVIRAVWSRHESNYNKMQHYFHCTKHCIHNHLRECAFNKGCAIQMPSPAVFEDKMRQCTKKNAKITAAIFSTCQCLAWHQWYKVKELQGSCVFIGNQYYIDRA